VARLALMPAGAARSTWRPVGEALGTPLTPRERKVLVEILKGRGNAAIARDLAISPHTVKNHVYNIFQKTGAGSRKELYLFAVHRGR